MSKNLEREESLWSNVLKQLECSLTTQIENYVYQSEALKTETTISNDERKLRSDRFYKALDNAALVFDKQIKLLKERELYSIMQLKAWEDRYACYKIEQERLIDVQKRELLAFKGDFNK